MKNITYYKYNVNRVFINVSCKFEVSYASVYIWKYFGFLVALKNIIYEYEIKGNSVFK